jgi:DNA-binding NarL/FixJ family response regulator
VSASVLIVDDNPNVREALRSFVEKQSLRVSGEAANGLEAIEKAKALTPDVILLDIAMPKMSGVEAAPILRRVAPNAQIIVVTLFADSLGTRLASAVGVDAVHSKMDGIDKLADALKSVAVADRCGQNDPEHAIAPLCVQVAGESDAQRLLEVIDELHREDPQKER